MNNGEVVITSMFKGSLGHKVVKLLLFGLYVSVRNLYRCKARFKIYLLKSKCITSDFGVDGTENSFSIADRAPLSVVINFQSSFIAQWTPSQSPCYSVYSKGTLGRCSLYVRLYFLTP